jgi:hypothetical protein
MADGDAQARSLAGESIFTPALGAVVCARVAAGESLRALCRDPAMPHRTTVRNWANSDPGFAADLSDAMRTKRFEQRRLDREIAAAKAARPPPVKGGSQSSYTEAKGEAICVRLANGESLIAIARDADMPCYGTVYNWLNRHPEFADAYVTARQVQADYLFDEAREVALAATPKTVWAERLRFDVIRWQTARMAPKKYCERVVVEAVVAERRAQADPEGGEVTIHHVDFQRAPDGKTILVAPPRNAEEEQEWVDAYGHPYDGPR